MSVTTAAITHLRSCQFPVSVAQGLDYLTQLKESVVLLSLYKANFPCEWEKSIAPFFPLASNSPYSPREIQFLELVDSQLFPLGLDCFEWDERLDFIPFWSHELDFYQRDIEEFEPSTQFLICLYDSTYLQGDWYTHFSIKPGRVVTADQVDFDQLKQLCNQASEPICYLYEAISIIDHSTGSIWLDETGESAFYFEWSQSNLSILAADWLIAQNFNQKAELLCLWLQESNQNKISLIQLWNDAKKSKL
ncbi:hypothetical protein NIES2119_29930 [[Phormidium ambiguum] IAM M-71]|uniref:Uncharacterized protein n=1 Tax=[Phormidium ambiguum] IAM M-71 TaxID=454136 RepID=A0A1U7I3Z0_9CYAN|nr:hypothetical protein [Phormidium ambiguum]OKH30894.1 hypothetical protein NIES2119_29930 [Phormidium ambiguum IAM M-71]